MIDGGLRDEVVLVTGASSGIGEAIATRLLIDGARVAVLARRVERLQALADACDEPERVLVLGADIRSEDQIRAAFARVADRWGGIDVLVNNAGLGRDASLLGGTTEAWREMLEVNVLALSVCTREAIAQMRGRGDDGHIVHVSSMAAHRMPQDGAMYAASKAAVRALTEGLRRELHACGSRIRVSSVSPGYVRTEFAEVYTGGDPEAADRTYGRFEVLEPDDIAEIVHHVLVQPTRVQIHDVLVRARAQPD